MKKLGFILLSLATLFATSCKDDPIEQEVTEVTLNFKANYDGDTFVTYKDYIYADGKKIRFNKLDFFVSSISLISDTDTPSNTDLVEIDYINLSYEEGNETEAEEGYSLTVKDIPTGSYSGIRIGFGVQADLNRTSPAEYGAGHPLSRNYWDGWSSYIFTKVEGYLDMNEDGILETGGENTESFSYHTGTDEAFNFVTFNKNLQLSEGNIENIIVNVDVKKLFRNTKPDRDANNDGFLDIQSFTGTHSNDQTLDIAINMMNNFGLAVTIE